MKAISEYFPSYQYQYLHIIISLTKILYKKPADSLHLAKFTTYTLRLRITAIQFIFQVFQRISKRKIRKMEMMGVADDE